MVVEPAYSISIVVSIALCLLHVVLLDAEKLIFSGCLPLGAHYFVLVCYFEILLPAIDFEESLAGAVGSPDLVPRMKTFYTDIASTLLLVHLSMFLLTVLSHQT
jgi:hypothetical protein